jgi:hypothetical protein
LPTEVFGAQNRIQVAQQGASQISTLFKLHSATWKEISAAARFHGIAFAGFIGDERFRSADDLDRSPERESV